MGWGWDHTKWPEQGFPTAVRHSIDLPQGVPSHDTLLEAILDSDPIVRQHRVVLEAKDGHAIWVNSKVLEDISPLPEDVEGGVIVRDASGKPTGDVDLSLDSIYTITAFQASFSTMPSISSPFPHLPIRTSKSTFNWL